MAVNPWDMHDKKEENGNATNEKGMDQVILPDSLKSHAEALGGLVIIWSALELQLSIMLGTMLDIEFTSKGDVLTGNIEMKPRLQILRALGVVVGENVPNNWYGRLILLLNTIENDLCRERNRMIHDIWATTDLPEELMRITLKPKILKQPVEMKMERLPISARAISNLSYRVLVASKEIAGLTIELKPSLKDKSL